MADLINSESKNAAGTAPSVAPAEEKARLKAKARAQFIGTYTHSIDNKGRLVIPQSFRNMLGDTFYLAPTREMNAIALYTEEDWIRTYDRYHELDAVNSTLLSFLDQFASLSFRDQECDNQGRLLLPPILRTVILNDEKDLIVCGEMDHASIISASDYYARFKAMRSNNAELLKAIDQLRIHDRSVT